MPASPLSTVVLQAVTVQPAPASRSTRAPIISTVRPMLPAPPPNLSLIAMRYPLQTRLEGRLTTQGPGRKG
jgi:hypothetical protein